MKLHQHMPTTLSVAILLVATSLPASARSSDDWKRYNLTAVFASSVEATPNEEMIAAEVPAEPIREGQTLTTADLLSAALSQPAKPPAGLFKHARLFLHVSSDDETLALSDELAACENLDIIAANGGNVPDTAICDSVSFRFEAGGKGIRVVKNGEPYRAYPLASGRYALNGTIFHIR